MLCTAKDSPYCNFNGVFPSGTNCDDYLSWLRNEMNAAVTDITINKDDNDDASNCDVDSNDNTDEGDGPKTDDASSKDDKGMKDDYFKGYFTFALWGYIPPPGREQYKTSFIETVIKMTPK